MASGGGFKRACGRLRRFYIKTRASDGGLWLVAASADTAEQLAAAIERVRVRYPERPIRVDEYARDGSVAAERAA